ncbi:PTS sugar transporter subunit IIC [Alkalicella caledoniensis]|uniref:Permease IIC component n=1 Tax=Alkalicella caledoniensis TaxID=2731377 RepID=A0A7G9W5L4_ALKCA|nr:PTS sugar transporter subunit IIC [Alkalicella caledoniensis]QNO13976.1 PTS sugar transporter subunit IIC [Alkalicella caledoniensis]
MQGFLKWLEEKFMPVVAKVGNQRHISAMKDGFIGAMPFMIIGSIMLILAFPPFPADTTNFIGKAWVNFSSNYFDILLVPNSMTMAIMSIFISAGIGYSLAKSYNLNPLSGALMALSGYLLIGAQAVDGGLPTAYMDGKGVFTAVIASFFAVELMRFLMVRNIRIKMPDGVPPAISASFDALIPVFLMVAILYPISIAVQHYTGYTVPAAIMEIFKPLVGAVDTLPGILFAVFLAHLLWFAGIHGASIVGGILGPFYAINISANQAALAAGEALPSIFTNPFWAFFITIGGSGATLGLVVLYLTSKSANLNAIGKVAAFPAIFNINEPVIFASPIVMNPILGIPFILAPMVTASIAYFALYTGMAGRGVALPPWTTPAPIGAMWGANWQISGLILCIVCIVVSTAIYYPFFKVYEKQLVKEEKANAAEIAADNTTLGA